MDRKVDDQKEKAFQECRQFFAAQDVAIDPFSFSKGWDLATDAYQAKLELVREVIRDASRTEGK